MRREDEGRGWRERIGKRVEGDSGERGWRESGEREKEKGKSGGIAYQLSGYTTQTTWLSTVTVSIVTETRKMVVVGY